MKKLVSIVLLLLVSACATHSDSPQAITPQAVTGPEVWGGADNVTKLKHLYFSEQPDAETLRIAASRGVTRVVNLREPGESDWDEQRVAEQLGIEYVNIPVAKKSDSLDQEAMSAIEEVVRQSQGEPVLLHCSSGNRASAWLATHLVDAHGMTVQDAIEVARATGLTKTDIENRVHAFFSGRQLR